MEKPEATHLLLTIQKTTEDGHCKTVVMKFPDTPYGALCRFHQARKLKAMGADISDIEPLLDSKPPRKRK